MKQRKHMDLDGCLSNIFPYLPMFLIFLASSFCWKRYASFNNQQKSATAQPAVFSQHWGDLCPEGRQLLWARHSPRTYGKVARYNFAKSLSPQKLLRCAVFSLEVRFCSRELCEYYCRYVFDTSITQICVYLFTYIPESPKRVKFQPLEPPNNRPTGLKFDTPGGSRHIHPGRWTWKLQITHLERKLIFQTSMILFHVHPQGCIFIVWVWPLLKM